MSNLIYTVKEIFTKALEVNKVKGYYIGPYQRGYKWKAKTASDHIPVLLCDLYDAYLKSQQENGQQEYYLQYLTLKKNKEIEKSETYFEVIDGQQRLTTLTLLFSALDWGGKIEENFTKNNGDYKVKYERYLGSAEKPSSNIFQEAHNNFKEILERESGLTYQNIDRQTESINDQGRYYMVWAAVQIHNFFRLLSEEDRRKFIAFIESKVKLILNLENEFTSAEEVFTSLNGNKVPLTDVYLIKGLLLTKASRVNKLTKNHLHFNEIMQKRSLLAKSWDEMNNWFSLDAVKTFFFDVDVQDGMKEFLKLIEFAEADRNEESTIKKFRSSLMPESTEEKFVPKYILFNKFQDHISSGSDALSYLEEIKKLYKRFRDWYEDNEMYNLLGYFLKSGGKIDSILNNNQEIRKTIYTHITKILNGNVSELGYYNQGKNNRLRKILLALSVFPEAKRQEFRFDFYTYANEDWTLEHIFPQNPETGVVDISNEEDKKWLKNQFKKKKNGSEWSEKFQNSEKVSVEKIFFIYDDFDETHSLGNMVLLSQSINSSLSNGFFNTKRKEILRKINRGDFVPKHTIDVFSKMLEIKNGKSNFDGDLRIWTKKDVEANAQYIVQRTEELKKNFKTKRK